MSSRTTRRLAGTIIASFAACMMFAAGSAPRAAQAPAPKNLATKAGQPPLAPVPNRVESGGLALTAKVLTSGGWVPPGGSYPIVLEYRAGDAGSGAATIQVRLHSAAVFVSATPAATSGSGTSTAPLSFTVPAQGAGESGKIVIEARARSLDEDAEVMWKDISADVSLAVAGAGTQEARTHGPKVTTKASARFGDRPFPVVMVQYQDIKHCTGAGEPYPDCTANHDAAGLDAAVNSQTSGKSLWQLYQDMSFGQLYPIGTVSPAPGSSTHAFTPGYVHKFAPAGAPSGYCAGTTVAPSHGTPAYANRIEDGWYLLPGTHSFYGSDSGGHAVVGQAAQQGLLSGIDDGCGPTGKIVYDAASVADPDIDYNDYDTDKDGVVDFFNLMFAGESSAQLPPPPTGANNVWPHKSDLRYYFTDASGLSGYVSNDQLRNHFGAPMFYTDATHAAMTTADTGLPVFVRVGPYNVNPENAVDVVSVVAHEYGHSLGLPDYYSNAFSAFGSWELMGTDFFQYMTAYTRQIMGWVVPRPLESGEITLRESKFDTGEIHWNRPDGTPYVLTGPGIHNADAYRLGLPTGQVISQVPSGTRAWYSGAGNDFGCAPNRGHNLDVFLPDLQQHASASAVTLRFKSLFEMEWDWDYGFVQVSDDGGQTWDTLPSQAGTTIQNTWNPNNASCFTTHNNGITGVSGAGSNTVANPNRLQTLYPAATFVDDQFDLTAYKGKSIILRFSYYTDAGTVKRGWFIDDVSVSADDKAVYTSDFEADDESTRLFPIGWVRVSTAQGAESDHAYYIELRDRISNDLDGKLQSERGVPTWAPGVLMVYSDEQHSRGNTSAANHPGQTPVDSSPDPGNTAPNLDDAAFDLTRPEFNGCTHIDNYVDPKGPDGMWKLPSALKFLVTMVSGISPDGAIPTQPATARLVAIVNPDCALEVAAPVLSLGPDYEAPDTDGAFTLSWSRPPGATGPDLVQEASSFAVLLEDDAEGGLGQWDTTTEGTGAFPWEASTVKSNSGTRSFWGRTSEGATAAASILTSKESFSIPLQGSTLLSYYDFYMNEGDDLVQLQVSDDDGASWETLAQSARSELAPDAAPALESEPMTLHEYDLSKMGGKTLKLRFRMQAGAENRAGSTPFGWYVDDIRIQSSDFRDLLDTADTSARLAGKPVGTYFYRVRTGYPAGTATLPSPFSNVMQVDVASSVPVTPPPVTPPVVGAPAPAGDTSRFGGSLGLGLLALFGVLAPLRRRGLNTRD